VASVDVVDVPSGTYTLAIYMFGSKEDSPTHQQTVVVGTRDQDLSIELPGL